MKKIALITGASSGMGADFVRQIAALGTVDEIWAVARRKDRLENLIRELPNVQGVALEADLSQNSGIEVLRKKLETEKPLVMLLVNNAGYGKLGAFTDSKRDETLGMVDLNVRALTALTYDVLPFMPPRSRIILIASLAAYLPIATMAVYAASKAYVLSFGTALSVELEPRGVGVTVLCPGPVKTEFFDVASGKTGYPVAAPLTSAQVVARTLKAAGKGRWNVMPAFTWRLLRFLTGLTPRRMAARMAGRFM